VSSDLGRTRWALIQGDESSIPAPFLVVLVFWLTVLFVTFGLFSPPNGTVITILVICAASIAAALFLIVELDRPFNGLIQISSKPLRDALGQLGH
jgi:protein-S-isoprenylcysteine O-methyltransferase Ste14